MTCYILANNNWIKPVKSVRYNGRRISNPPDELVIELGEGYPLQTTDQPEYDEDNQYVTKSYELSDGVIKEVWTIHDYERPEPEPQQEEPEQPQPEQEQESESQPEQEQQEQQSEPEPEPEQPQPEPEATE